MILADSQAEAPGRDGGYLSELADLLFLPEHRIRLLCMLAAHIDTSGKSSDANLSGRPVLAMAAYVAPEEAWTRFAKLWRRDLLDKFWLKTAHHKDFHAGRSCRRCPKGQYDGWSERKKDRYAEVGSKIINDHVSVGLVVFSQHVVH
jgi:hypothetical protein